MRWRLGWILGLWCARVALAWPGAGAEVTNLNGRSYHRDELYSWYARVRMQYCQVGDTYPTIHAAGYVLIGGRVLQVANPSTLVLETLDPSKLVANPSTLALESQGPDKLFAVYVADNRAARVKVGVPMLCLGKKVQPFAYSAGGTAAPQEIPGYEHVSLISYPQFLEGAKRGYFQDLLPQGLAGTNAPARSPGPWR